MNINRGFFVNILRRMKYIDEDLQNICRRVSTRIKDKKSQQIPTTPFTANELQSLNLNTNSFMDKLKQDVNHNLPTYSMVKIVIHIYLLAIFFVL